MPEEQQKKPRTALITAGTKGIGLAIARAFAREGYNLALTSREPKQDKMFTQRDFKGRKVSLLTLELRDDKNIVGAFQAAVKTLGTIDVLVNNAGMILRKSIIDVTWDEWDEVMDTNLKGAYFLSAQFARHCLERGHPGSIVNIASTHGITAMADRSVYGISKGAMIKMTKTMAIEWAENNIRVNAIAPATVLTASRQEVFNDPESREKMLARIPNRKFVTEEEVAAAACFLASNDANSITGHTLALDGGLLSI